MNVNGTEYITEVDHKIIINRLERERDEARHELSNCKSHFAIYDGKELDESVHMAVLHALKERDQLRKVADELAGSVKAEFGFNNWRLATYSQLPHVIAKQKESK